MSLKTGPDEIMERDDLRREVERDDLRQEVERLKNLIGIIQRESLNDLDLISKFNAEIAALKVKLAEAEKREARIMSEITFNEIFKFRKSVRCFDGMQIFRTMLHDESSRDRHFAELILGLIFSVPSYVGTPAYNPIRTLDGLISQVAKKGQLPQSWHVEFLEDRWLKHIAERTEIIDGTGTIRRVPPELVSECRLVIDSWSNERTPKR